MTNLSPMETPPSTELTINQNRIELDEAYMQMAEIWAKRSKANRSQVGALIVKDKQIISDGYNGMPSGVEDDVCETIEWMDTDAGGWLHPEEIYERWPYVITNSGPNHGRRYRLATKQEVLHAESNALLKISENGGIGAQGATLYTTLSPCPECAKLIKQAKIKRVVYRHQYRLTDGLDLLRKLGVEVEQLK